MFGKILGTITLLVVYSNAEVRNCDDLGVLFYEQFASCTPVMSDDDNCPIKFECPRTLLKDDKCIIQGSMYDNETDIAELKGCNVDCRCRDDGFGNTITCAEVDCPLDWEKGCYLVESLGDCCPSRLECSKTSVHTCEFDGKPYEEGEKFYPPNTCYECVCGKGFKGELEEPFCQKVSCSLSHFNLNNVERKCAPYYVTTATKSSLCCPWMFICGDDIENKKFEVLHKNITEEPICDTCMFMDYKMAVGDVIELSRNVRCTCNLPPLASCTGTEHF